MSDILCKLIEVGNAVGKVTSAMMYDSGFMTVDGVKPSGKKFAITLNVKEEEEDA